MSATPSTAGTMPDTWVATDALGRTVSTAETVGPPRKDRFVGVFYFLWLGEHGRGGPYDISKILAKDPNAIDDPKNPLWGPVGSFHHWGEPLFGYYLSDDPWVLRKHAQMLSDAGVDTVIFDVTNQATYAKNYLALCKVWSQVRKEGGATPRIAFLTPFWDPHKVVRTLYDDFYGKGLYKDLWFQWKGKPLILADPANVDDDAKGFFTFRKPQPSYFEGPTGPDQWSWLEVYPQHVFKNSAGEAEQMSVGIGQNGILPNRCAAFTEKGTHGRSWHDGAEDTSPGAVNLGLNVTEQWERALKVDPEFIFITGWNEWVALNLPSFNGVSKPPMFVDQFTQEYSRDIEPMRGGHADAYYYQMVDYIRRFKGANPIPKTSAPKTIAIDGKFDDWKDVGPEYRDDAFDTEHRDHPGWNPAVRYTNTTGRNDFVALKVARDSKFIYFYARTRDPITPHTDPNWMLLFINTDHYSNLLTGETYNNQFLVNDKVLNDTATTLDQWSIAPTKGRSANWSELTWNWKATVRYAVKGCELELAIPRKALGFGDPSKPIRFDFKWADNIQSFDPIEFTINGDTAPNGRFAYRYQE
jgi:hypothetical protein